MGQLLENKMSLVVDQYARANRYAVILNSSNRPAPPFWSATSADMTEEMVKRYGEARLPRRARNSAVHNSTLCPDAYRAAAAGEASESLTST